MSGWSQISVPRCELYRCSLVWRQHVSQTLLWLPWQHHAHWDLDTFQTCIHPTMLLQRPFPQWRLTALPSIPYNYSHLSPAGYTVSLHTNNRTGMKTLHIARSMQFWSVLQPSDFISNGLGKPVLNSFVPRQHWAGGLWILFFIFR